MGQKLVRGDVVFADLGKLPHSSIQAGKRPCIIVSNNANNHFSTVLQVCPCTAQIEKSDNPVHVRIRPRDVHGRLPKTSIAMAEQTRPLDKEYILYKMGYLDSTIMRQVDKALKIQLELNRKSNRKNNRKS